MEPRVFPGHVQIPLQALDVPEYVIQLGPQVSEGLGGSPLGSAVALHRHSRMAAPPQSPPALKGGVAESDAVDVALAALQAVLLPLGGEKLG